MGWLQQSYKQLQSKAVLRMGGTHAGWKHARTKVSMERAGMHKHVAGIIGAALLAAGLFVTSPAMALEAGQVAKGAEEMQYTPRNISVVRKMNEDELRRVAARGLTEDRLFRVSMYSAGGFAVEVLGDMATLLNPVASLLDANITFQDAVFNPLNPTAIMDSSGSFMVRLPQTIGVISVENIRVAGSNGKSFGSVTIRDIDLRGTTIRVTARR